jgi:V/A-type H+-transporting ATPase subunit I
LKILDAESQATMMPLAIVIGVIHLSLANLVIAWLQRGRTTALAPLGWVAVMAGATLAGMAAFAELSTPFASGLTRIGAILLIGGLLAVFLFTSPRPIRSLSFKNHALRALEGLQGLVGFSGLFGDVLSYLRLFALGLSSAKLAQTFNALGSDAWDAAGFGVIAGIGIVILGHTLNLVLCIMSAVVHGLRLNCIEFYKWALPDEGYLYKAFAKKARQT